MISQNTKKFLRNFFFFVMGGYFLWPYSLQWDPKYLFSDSTEIRLAKRSTKYRCNSLRWINRILSSFSESFFPDFIWGYCLFHKSPQWASKYHVANSTRTALAKGFLGESWNTVRWFQRTQKVSQKASFSLLSEDISFGPIVFNGIRNICSQIRQK